MEHESDIIDPEILIDKNIQLPHRVASQMEPPNTKETSTTEKLFVQPKFQLSIHNRRQRTRDPPFFS